MMARFLMAASMALVLSACATATETPMQDLTINIVGTGRAICDLRQANYRYRAHAPGTISIQKARDPLFIRCAAPGNRELSQIIESEVSSMTAGNIATGVLPGMAWDHFSGAMYKYPERVVMDFSNIPPRSYDEPDYQKVFKGNPDMYSMEEFRPGIPAIQSDIGRGVAELPRRNGGDSAGVSVISNTPNTLGIQSAPAMAATLESEALPPPAISAGQSRSMDAEGLTRMMNPQVFNQGAQ